MKIILILGIHLHLLLSLSYLPKADHYLSIMIITGWCYPLLLVIGLLIHVSRSGYGVRTTNRMDQNWFQGLFNHGQPRSSLSVLGS